MLISITLLAISGVSVALVLSQAKFGQQPQGQRLGRIRQSPNYRDGEFRNLEETPTMTGDGSFFRALYEFLFKKVPDRTPAGAIPSVKTDLKNIPIDHEVWVWFGHSSYYLQLDGKRILVDPVFSGYASPFSWMVKAFKGSDRYRPDDFPEIDLLLITHDHWDHLDYETIRKLTPNVKQFVCALGVGAHLERWGVSRDRITELDWFEQTSVTGQFTIHATPARHFSGRGLKRNQTLWVSFVLSTSRHKLFLGGDGGYGVHFAQIGKQFGPFDLAILEQGQYNAKWKHIHLMPAELPRAVADLQASRVLPVHNSKFALAEHPWTEPLDSAAVALQSSAAKLLTPMIGEIVDLNNPDQLFREWWKQAPGAADGR